MGHELAGVRGVYSHVSQPMIDALLAGLQRPVGDDHQKAPSDQLKQLGRYWDRTSDPYRAKVAQQAV
jgi:hypothetical protein